MLIESGAKRAHGNRQRGTRRGSGENSQMGFEASRIAALRYRDQSEHLPLVDGERGVTRKRDLQPPPPGISQRLEEDIKGRQHFAGILSAQERELARDQGT